MDVKRELIKISEKIDEKVDWEQVLFELKQVAKQIKKKQSKS